MVRVLHFLNGLGMGGAESFVMNIYRNIDRTRVQFDFMVRSDDLGPYVDEVEAMGGKVFRSPFFPSKAVANYRYLSKFFKEHAEDYAAVHVHANALVYIIPLSLAKRNGVPVRIIHSHSSCGYNSLASALHRLNKRIIPSLVTDRFSCSDLAGKWMFDNDDCKLILNGIDIDAYKFSPQKRQEIREKLCIETKKVIGHVGRFIKVKNHKFLIDCFDKIHSADSNTVLLLLGDGEDMAEIKAFVREKGLDNCVVFTGAVGNVSDYLSAMDLFMFPSLWEGLPLTLIEAQANGMPCLISNKISKTIVMNKNVISLPIDNEKAWVTAAAACYERTDELSSELCKFDIKTISRELEDFYSERADLSK